MADNYLERHQEEYEKRKAEWLKGGRKKHRPALERPEDESL
ncbi:MAG TPA: dehydrogenase [Bacteroidales bacterium]|jgi:hypothetical protein|nr:dehydrogenase [Bacteroidales bacterium]